MSCDNEFKSFIIGLTERLLNTINLSDYTKYKFLVDSNLTSFEPEAAGYLVSGLDFHKFYFDNSQVKDKPAIRTSILSPVVHRLSPESACIAYIRLTQVFERNGNTYTTRSEETRVWHNRDGKWQMIHFHRSNIQK